MNLGLLAYGLDRSLTGIGRYSIEMARALARTEAKLDLTLMTAGKCTASTGMRGFNKVPLRGCRLLPALITYGNLLIPRTGQRLKLDVVHDPTGVSPFLFGAGGAKIVVTVHDVFAWSCPGNSSVLDVLIYHYWLPHILTKVDAIITVSEQSRKDIQRYLSVPSDRILLIPNGVARRFHLLPPDLVKEHLKKRFGLSKPYVLFVGTITVRKNIERALEAFAVLRERFPELLFVLAGPRTWKQTPIERILKRHNLHNRVHLTGPVADIDLTALYNGAELFVFPSLYEGFGFPPLEAMACGTPVIASSISAIPEVTRDAALQVDPYNVEELAGAIQRVLDNPELAQDLRERGLDRAAEFTWEKTARQTIAVYEKVLGEKLF